MSLSGIVEADHGDGDTALQIRRIGTALCVAGEIDHASAQEFRRALDECDRDGRIVALDLTEVTFFSAAGVNCFVGAGWHRRPHDPVIASPAVRRVLELCDLTQLLT